MAKGVGGMQPNAQRSGAPRGNQKTTTWNRKSAIYCCFNAQLSVQESIAELRISVFVNSIDLKRFQGLLPGRTIESHWDLCFRFDFVHSICDRSPWQ